jgi:hypothetical protein
MITVISFKFSKYKIVSDWICYFQDPTSQLLQLAEAKGLAQKFHALSLGQGQAPIATRMIKEGIREVF